MKAKIPVEKVIDRLEARLEQNTKDEASKEALEKKYQDAYEKYSKEFVSKFVSKLKVNNVNVNRSWSKVEVRYELPEDMVIPKEPERDFVKTLSSWEIEEINEALSVLKMSDDTHVTASVLGRISKYLA